MRLRTSARTAGKRKSYNEKTVQFSDDEESDGVAAPNGGDDGSDEEVQGDALAAAEEEEDDDIEMVDASSDSEEAGSAVEYDGPSGEPNTTTPSRGPRRKKRPVVNAYRNSYHELPPYPLEPRLMSRVYTGPLRRYARYSNLRDTLYGPEYSRIRTIWELDSRWTNHQILPPKFPPEHTNGVLPSPWLPQHHEIEQEKTAVLWYHKHQEAIWDLQQSHPSNKHGARLLVPRCDFDLVAFLGSADAQQEVRLEQQKPIPLSPLGLPIADPLLETQPPSGWMFDVGGLVLGMGWQPSSAGGKQLLAVATVPHSDQDHIASEELRQAQKKEAGAVQFWEFEASKEDEGLASLSGTAPRFTGASCFGWGRPKRLQWCPTPLNLAGICGRLALLCGDGKVRVLDVKAFEDAATPVYDWIDSPIATLGQNDEDGVEVTCLTWVNVNRLALGHSDGSVTLWSVYPCKLLQRLTPHSTYVLDICSAYPSYPNLICTAPVGGCITLIDLNQPSAEMAYLPTCIINFQPHLLAWNETMQGFVIQYPGSNTSNTSLAFAHVHFFCQSRTMFAGPNAVTCLSSGSTHPYVLVGCADGSLWSFNALAKLFSQKYERTYKMKILEHEYRPVEPKQPRYHPALSRPADESPAPDLLLRGAVRILQGFSPEENDDARAEYRREAEKKKKKKHETEREAGGRKARGRPKKATTDGTVQEEELEPPIDLIGARSFTHEPLTRITSVQWNPNLDFSCWAACAFGSGLIRVMDLGRQ